MQTRQRIIILNSKCHIEMNGDQKGLVLPTIRNGHEKNKLGN